jgi:hypothetical protein
MSDPDAGDGSAPIDALASPLRNRSVGSAKSEFCVFEQVDDARRAPMRGIPVPTHRTEDEGWYVIEGTLRFRYGSREFDAPAGSGVLLRHGTPHTFWNPGAEPARYLLIARPKTAALLAALHEGGAYPPRLRELFDRFDVDLLEEGSP